MSWTANFPPVKEKVMDKANTKQEGGNHYKKDGKLQHWDLAIMFGWDPFQYQITKYVMRWKFKHKSPEERLLDLKKARHFLDKYIENAAKYDPEPKAVGHISHATYEFLWSSYTGVFTCTKCGTSIYGARNYEEANEIHGECPGRSYVNQDR